MNRKIPLILIGICVLALYPYRMQAQSNQSESERAPAIQPAPTLGIDTAMDQLPLNGAQSQPMFPTEEPDFSYESIRKLLEKMSQNKGANDDVFLNMLLSVPFEKRQYVFPQLHENIGMPNKILTHPEISVWKGKVPTTIPANLKEFAKEHLAYLPTTYYILLDPDQWQEIPTERTQTPTNDLNLKYPTLKMTPHIDEFYAFPKVQDLYKLSPETAQNYTKTDLKPADIERLFNTKKALEDYLNQRKDKEDILDRLNALMRYNNDVAEDLSYPYLSLVSRLKLILGEEQINRFFQSQGWKDAFEFAEKSDRVLKAYRVNFLKPNVAIQLSKIRAYPKDAPINETMKNLQMYAKMHEAKPADVYLVEPYLNRLRQELKPDFILWLMTPIYIE
ncbi:MAG: hypothetical protein IKY98_01295 [Alphaproteobacteria bacterium]|nr:hypothetical protein [Alphaproteobacteria bacterium]